MADDEEAFRLLLAALVSAGGELTITAEADQWVAERARAGDEVGYATTGHGDRLSLRLVDFSGVPLPSSAEASSGGQV